MRRAGDAPGLHPRLVRGVRDRRAPRSRDLGLRGRPDPEPGGPGTTPRAARRTPASRTVAWSSRPARRITLARSIPRPASTPWENGSSSTAAIEVRARIPTGVGSWPAIWMMGTNVKAVGWPECGEIDIMENVGYEPDTIYATVHTPGSVNDPGRWSGAGTSTYPPFDGFHVYAVEWQDDRLDFSCDDTTYFTYRKNASFPSYWRFDRPFYLLLNLAIGGTWGGAHGIEDTIFPLRYAIDYVRYYEWD
ncbi:MAG: glycoside hydrolase family 16 protein [Desulfosudis oleivorans]|nr:glycoside hydrolase family 16 protein [Desulfosudis oleivorans]